MRRLTVKLRGRATTPTWRRGRTISSRARGAKPTTHHGPRQRLLGSTPVCRVVHTVISWYLSKLKRIYPFKTADVIAILVGI